LRAYGQRELQAALEIGEPRRIAADEAREPARGQRMSHELVMPDGLRQLDCTLRPPDSRVDVVRLRVQVCQIVIGPRQLETGRQRLERRHGLNAVLPGFLAQAR